MMHPLTLLTILYYVARYLSQRTISLKLVFLP